MAAAAGFLLTANEVPLKGFLDQRTWKRQNFAQAVKENGKIVAMKFLPGNSYGSPGNVGYPMDGGKDIDAPYEGIAFEVKGDGSNEWGCFSIGESRALQGHAYFPLKNKEWQKFTFN